MSKVFYMKFKKVSRGALDKVGGLPTHLPPCFPVSTFTGKQLGFLFQMYCDSNRLPVEGTLCIQVYQSINIDSGDDGEPVVIKVPLDAPLNKRNEGTIHPEVAEYDILWEEGTEPDYLPDYLDDSIESYKMLDSKLGGAVPPGFSNEKFLGWVAEEPIDFNFGGLLCIILKDNSELEIKII